MAPRCPVNQTRALKHTASSPPLPAREAFHLNLRVGLPERPLLGSASGNSAPSGNPV